MKDTTYDFDHLGVGAISYPEPAVKEYLSNTDLNTKEWRVCDYTGQFGVYETEEQAFKAASSLAQWSSSVVVKEVDVIVVKVTGVVSTKENRND